MSGREAEVSATADKVTLPTIFYDGRNGDYWLSLDGRFLRLSEKDVKLHFLNAGCRWAREDARGMTDGQRVLVGAQINRYVDYAGSLGGHKVGSFTTPGGKHVLVTQAPNHHWPKPGKKDGCEFIERFMATLFSTTEQTERFLFWLRVSFASLLAGDLRPGQMCVFAGPAECGKSFLQVVISEIFGGRVADPFSWMIGETNFNGHLAGAEHWAMEESMSSTDIRSRNRFGARIKEVVVGGLLNVHTKGKDITVSVPTFRRLTLSVNDEHENLLIVPPLNASLQDKINLFKCAPASHTLCEDRRKNMQRVRAEMPAFVEQLMRLKIPDRLKSSRFGVTHFHHPALLEALCSTEPHVRLLELIDEVIFEKHDGSPWCGSADQLEIELRKSSFNFAIEKLLYFSGSCGTYLGRIKTKLPARVQSKQSNGRQRWTITAPKDSDDQTMPLPL
jgi:hypothetical protein